VFRMNGITITCYLLVAIDDRHFQSLYFMITKDRKGVTCFRQVTSLHILITIVIRAVCSDITVGVY
jgi:hypothetical protein